MYTFKLRFFSVSLLVCLLVAFSPSGTHAAPMIFRVTPTGLTSGTCNSWAYACNLQYALALAPEGNQVWVAAGTYTPTDGFDRSASFHLKSLLTVYGGFVGTETTPTQRDPAAHVTILSGEIGWPGNSDNSYHVVTGSGTDGSAVLDGFTITGGMASEDGFPFLNDRGGGMYILNGRPTLVNIIFSNNSAVREGGGMYNEGGSPTLRNVSFTNNITAWDGGGMANESSSPTLTNVTFMGNQGPEAGGGMYNWNSSPTLTNVTFGGNFSQRGGGMYGCSGSLTLSGVTFDGNTADQGGGMYSSSSDATLAQVTFRNNSASYGAGLFSEDGNLILTDNIFDVNAAVVTAGGMYIQGSGLILVDTTFNGNSAQMGGGIYSQDSNSFVLTNIAFTNNTAQFNGGAIVSVNNNALLTNITFHNNSATVGSGIHIEEGTLTLRNATFAGNSAVNAASGIYNYQSNLTIINSIFWGNTANNAAQIYNNGSTPTISNSIVQDGCPQDSNCTNVITADPRLGEFGSYGGITQTIPLLSGSSAVEAGDDANCPSTDQRGVSRPQGRHCDIGTYEGQVITEPGVYDDMDPAWNYAGKWASYYGKGPYKNTLHQSKLMDGYAEVIFRGVQVELMYLKGPDRGLIDVYIDGALVDTINANGTWTWRVLWTSPLLSDGIHTVRFQAASSGWIDMDAIQILGATGVSPGTYDDTDAAWSYTGTWGTWT